LSLRTASPVAPLGYAGVGFGIYGAAGGGPVRFYIQTTDGGAASPGVAFTPAAGQWMEVAVTWAQLGNPGQAARLDWQESVGAAQPRFYLDNVRLLACGALTAPADLTAGRSGGDVVLRWSPAAGAASYQVWRDPAPYFLPDPAAGAPLAIVTAAVYTDTNRIGAAAGPDFYAVTGVNRCGQAAGAPIAPRGGRFDFPLAP
jgi:hypothetical protein